MLALWGFLKAINPRTWLILGLIAGLGYIGIRLYNLGVEHERVKAQSQVLLQDETQAKKERDAFQQKMSQALQLADSAIAAEQVAVHRAEALDNRLASEHQQQIDLEKNISQIADPELFADIRTRLAKHPADRAPSFYPDELREIDLRVAKVPGLQDQISTLNEKVMALQDRSVAQGQEIAAVRQQNAALLVYATQLHGHYKTAFDAAQPRVGLFMKIITFGLKKPRKLALPPPESIPIPAS